jgi:hypothetical protein
MRRLFAIALMALVVRAAAAQPNQKPHLAVYRDRETLVIREIRNVPVAGNDGCELLVYRVEPLTTRLALWRGANNSASRPVTDTAEIRIASFFQSDSLAAGAAIFVPTTAVADIVAATDRNDATLADLLKFFEGRRVYSYDMTRLRPAPGHAKVRNRWEGKDLVVEPETPLPDSVVISFRHDDGAAASTMQVLKSASGDAVVPAAASVRYAGANIGRGEAVSIITDHSTADRLRTVLAQNDTFPYAGLDVLLRSGTVYGADSAKASPAAAGTSTPPPPAPVTVPLTGNLMARLREIRRRVPDPVATAKAPDDVTAATIASYDAFTAALPQDILKEQRVWEQVNQTFLDNLAWDAFFKYVSFGNSFGRLEYIRSQLDAHDPTKNIGEEFIFSYADRFLRRYPIERSNLSDRITIAEGYFRTAPHVANFRGEPLQIDTVIAEYYQLVGRFLASDTASAIEHWQGDSKRKLTDDQYFDCGQRLAKMEVYLPERSSLAKKFTDYATRGDVAKIQQRIWDKFFATPGRAQELKAASYSIRAPRTTAHNQLVFYDISYATNGQTKPLGHLILVQPNAHLHYGYTVKKGEVGYSAADLQQRFKASHYYVITTGSYTEATGRTSGLSAENGVIKNFHVTHKMDGFVAIHHGVVDVFDLEEGFQLPGHNGRIRPIQSLRDFHTFITWLRTEGVSGFQTHLLVKNDQSAIQPDKTSESRRERRFLLYMRDVRKQRVIAFLDVPNSEAISFIEATAIIQRLMHDAYHYSVEAAVNLDTGSFDILRVQSDAGAVIFQTSVDIDKATNLVVVYE